MGVTITSQFSGNQSPQLLPSPTLDTQSRQPSPTPNSDSSSSPQPQGSLATQSPSATGVDYSRLEGFLKAGKWKDADQETAKLMLKVTNPGQEGSLDIDAIKNFPCEVLSQIDYLWVNNSGGKFGFSVQQKIYVEDCGGKLNGQYDERVFECFGDRLKWRVNEQWIKSPDVTFSLQAPTAHLPVVESWGTELRGYYYEITPWQEGGPNHAPEKFFFSLLQRLVSCAVPSVLPK